MWARKLKAGDRLVIGQVIIEINKAGPNTLKLSVDAPPEMPISFDSSGPVDAAGQGSGSLQARVELDVIELPPIHHI